ncbi:hypothetical protein ACLMJK_003232 [Lecanora helva]
MLLALPWLSGGGTRDEVDAKTQDEGEGKSDETDTSDIRNCCVPGDFLQFTVVLVVNGNGRNGVVRSKEPSPAAMHPRRKSAMHGKISRWTAQPQIQPGKAKSNPYAVLNALPPQLIINKASHLATEDSSVANRSQSAVGEI